MTAPLLLLTSGLSSYHDIPKRFYYAIFHVGNGGDVLVESDAIMEIDAYK